MDNIRKMFLLSLLTVLVVFLFTGCKSGNMVSPELNGGLTGNGNTRLAIKTQTSDINRVTITSAKILLKEIEFEPSEGGAGACQLAIGPVVANIFMDGRISEFVIGNIVTGSYDRLRFKVHKPSHGETVSDPEFTRNGQRYSVIVQGIYNEQPFTYKSRLTANIRLLFTDPLRINESSKIRIVMLISPQMWFLKNGDFLDPNEPQNRDKIDQNIKDSFRWVYIEE